MSKRNAVAQMAVSARRALLVALYIVSIALSSTWFFGPWQVRTSLQALVALTLLVWLCTCLWRGQGLPRTPIDLPILAVLVAVGVSIACAVDRRLALESIFFIMAYPLAFLFLMDLARDESWREALVAGALMAGGVFASISLLEVMDWYVGLGLIWPYDGWLELGQGPFPPSRLRVGVLWFVWPTTLAAYFGFLLPLAGARALAASRWQERSFWAAFTCLLGLALLLTFTRGGWLGTAVALALVAIVVASQRLGLGRIAAVLRRKPVHLAAGAAVFLVAFFISARLVGPGLEGRGLASDLFRLELARMSLASFVERPLFGSGPDTFALATMPHLQLQLLGRVIDHPHNMFLTLLVEEGALGLLAALALGVSLAWTAARALAHPAGRGAYYLVLGSVAGLVALAVHSLFNSFLHTPGVFLFAIISAALVVTSAPSAAGRRGRWSAALALAGLLVVLGVVANFELARACQQRAVAADADVPEAARELERAVALDPWFGFYRQQLGHAYSLLAEQDPKGDWARRAVEELRRGLAAEPHYYLNQLRLAAVLRETGDFMGALAAVARAVATNPMDYRPFLGLGVLLEEDGRMDEAVKAYARALIEEPTILGAPFWKETPLRRERADAIYAEAFRQAEALPEWRRAANRGALAMASADYDRAVAEYGDTYPLGLGDAYLAKGEFEKAMVAYEEAAGEAAVRWRAYEGIGRVHLAAGRLREAERALRTALFVSTDQPMSNSEEGDVFYYLGQAYEKLGDMQRAASAYERAVPGPAIYLAYGTFLWHRSTPTIVEPRWLRQLDIVHTAPEKAARFAALERVYTASGDEDGVRRLRELVKRLAVTG